MANDFLTIKESAKFLEVTAQTLRNWDKQGKLKPHRHPMNNYRIYKKKDLIKLSIQIKGDNYALQVNPRI